MNSHPIYPYCQSCYSFGYKVIHFAGDCRYETKSQQQDPKCVEVGTDNKKRKHENEPELNEFKKTRKT